MMDTKKKKLSFIIVASIMILAALSLNMAVATLRVSFRKEKVDPSNPLKTLPARLGPWIQASVDVSLNADMEHELGATEYVIRKYLDSRRMTPAQLTELSKAKTAEEYYKVVTEVMHVDRRALMEFQMTFYTGSVDTVAHVPDRCFIADGYVPSTYRIDRWPVMSGSKSGATDLELRFINFEDSISDRGASAKLPTQVAYVFHCNGAWESDPINGVRVKLQNLFERHAYYSKVELKMNLPEPEAAVATMQDFLTNAIPEIESILPDWKAKQQQWASADKK